MQYELFEKIIFPVLLKGYNDNNVELMLWLAKLCVDLYRNKKVWEKINYKTKCEILEECYDLEPQNEVVSKLLLEEKISEIRYHIHEWPDGILYGHNGATADECRILLSEIPLINKLDKTKEYQGLIKDYENKITEYMERDYMK